ncbi:Acg family FMN-binding oxidoreductase [Palleronia pelagia]|uniref:Nitroreductase family protein n=1 Tax=Palleronia pelagia TaxID=387096 RepID=A0A1H8GW29_9RHOB|nr:twin-arginine translocation pathway signal protein [Palleronia pelagia]SEN48166.1 hypothetical protein SAMN04488011_104227 [Palleronia pelagia]
MTLTRRKMIALVGGGAITAVAGGAGAFAVTRRPDRALAPWDAAGTPTDPRARALSFALLAPNPHNRQPWLARLDGDDTVTLWRDPARDLPVTDPFGRQLTIGMGCFIELMEMAAAEGGFAVETTLFPEGETADSPVARSRFLPGAGAPDPLFAHVMDRRSHKIGFDARPVPGRYARDFAPFADVVLPGPRAEALRRIAIDAWHREAATDDAWQESVDLLRIGKAQINANPDGIDLGGPMMDSLHALGLLTREGAGDRNDPNVRAAIDETTQAIAGAPAFVVMTTQTNTRRDQIETGRRWMRLNLASTGAGLGLRPVSQALQEYPEMAEIHADIHAREAPGGGTVQMLGLLGYGPLTPRTPRWPLEAKLIG